MDLALAPETLARWQFGITTVYHFLFVPLTISLAALTAGLQTAWVRTENEKYLRATKFWGKLFLINIAMGVVTGIVQEFQFGMNWSDYSRFVGDIFGAPLAFEALIAFFFESTFIGLWIFGWDKLPKKIHLACIWMVSIGTVLSAYFILAANSWMQHPVGYRINEERGRAELTDFWRVLTQDTAVTQFFHTITAAFLVGGAFMVGIAAFHLARKKHIPVMRTSLRLGLITVVVAGLLTAVSGDSLAKVMFRQQPMKMAAAEALWDGQERAPFSIFAYGDVSKGHNSVEISLPGILSFLANNDPNSYVPGINDINKESQEKYGPGDYRPNIPVAFWSFRWMIGFGMASFGLGLLGLWLTRKKFLLPPALRTGEDEVPHLVLFKNKALSPRLTKLYWVVALWTLLFPLIANSWGWIFTEMGRQPWVVYGVLQTRAGVSPGVSQGEVITSMIVFTLLYAVLAVIEVKLLVKYIKAGPPELTEDDLNPPTKIGGHDEEDADRPMAFSY
ncbi:MULTISPECIES: cytochrome ubiquinol oxidase subunit I [Streptomyces]|uniref:cytochrome ubiquinol oxidase subunit I n=1 Tax=Streptomyces TaxID=1883 RepID=UPI000241B597|nr:MULTISPECIES: cytochrome ubiquinol oxidase subunit I [Streptomyces]EHM26853.1 putative cytochrome d ubiquinol oxidase subunit I [Streptomyces sp. W007]MCX4485913.1 cytochrome ubiquinol oxidase subunit I [Streptomyces anulatus]MCX4507294.1 cytochrome ubiquinol oxidase subunit I [Streptomyces anulatus]MCX4519601.1 cytochrome ubiquinol oxidase subunit I [Streptomyces anulatus]MCX4602483.1 cytochrome ubiquinol oxidase subunit I [Streptomyces anulatus]